NVGEPATGRPNLVRHRLDHLERRALTDLQRDLLLQQLAMRIHRLGHAGHVIADLQAQQDASAGPSRLHGLTATSTPCWLQYPARKSRPTGTDTRELEPPYSMNTTTAISGSSTGLKPMNQAWV